MADYWDVGQFHKSRNGKTFFQRLGSAKQNAKGEWDIYLNALPLPIVVADVSTVRLSICRKKIPQKKDDLD